MSNHVQDPVDVRTINWKEDEASKEGTQALRYTSPKVPSAIIA